MKAEAATSGIDQIGHRLNLTYFTGGPFRVYTGNLRQRCQPSTCPAALGISESVCIRRAASAAGPALPEHVAVASRSGLDHVPTHARAGTRGAWKWGSWRRAAGVWQAVASLSQAGAAGRIDRDGNAISESETVH